jgi:predicted nucleic acid-binding protein
VKILLDTNILLRIIDRASPHHQVVLAATSDPLARGCTLCICTQNLTEFWSVGTRPIAIRGLGLAPSVTRTILDSFLHRFATLPEYPTLAARWLDLATRYAVQGKSAHDTRLVAVMLENGVDHLLTFNSADFARYTEITTLDPSLPGAFPTC